MPTSSISKYISGKWFGLHWKNIRGNQKSHYIKSIWVVSIRNIVRMVERSYTYLMIGFCINYTFAYYILLTSYLIHLSNSISFLDIWKLLPSYFSNYILLTKVTTWQKVIIQISIFYQSISEKNKDLCVLQM